MGLTKFHWNSHQNTKLFIQEIAFEDIVGKMVASLPRPLCVTFSQILPNQYNPQSHQNDLLARKTNTDCLYSGKWRRSNAQFSCQQGNKWATASGQVQVWIILYSWIPPVWLLNCLCGINFLRLQYSTNMYWRFINRRSADIGGKRGGSYHQTLCWYKDRWLL